MEKEGMRWREGGRERDRDRCELTLTSAHLTHQSLKCSRCSHGTVSYILVPVSLQKMVLILGS